MQLARVLDVVEGLLRASGHPDIVEIRRYGSEPSITGVRVRYQATSTASLFGATWPGAQPLAVPEKLPAPKQRRAPRIAIFAVWLLEAARPQEFRSWQLVALPGLGSEKEPGPFPAGVSLECADGSTTLLRASATGATVGSEPDEEPFPDYVIPELRRS
jgi:hypothetical protein